jgi:hypothetical protein
MALSGRSMKCRLVGLVGILILFSCDKKEAPGPVTPVPFTAAHVNDAFWAPKIEINRTATIPSAFKQCEINGRIDNFALAAGKIKGEHKGDYPFDDTDVYKVIEGASYALAVKYDARLDAYLDSVIALIAGAQEPDGYLCTCLTNKCKRLERWYGKGRWDRLNSHELYNCGHLYEAAVAHYPRRAKIPKVRVLLNPELNGHAYLALLQTLHPVFKLCLNRVKKHVCQEEAAYWRYADKTIYSLCSAITEDDVSLVI